MAFDISYIFTAKNNYTPTAKKIVDANKKVEAGNKEVARSIIKKNTAFRKLKASLLIAKRRLRDYKKESKATAKISSGLTSKLKQFAALAVTGLGITKIVQEGAALEDSMADLSAITGAAGKDLSFLSDEVKRLSLESRTLPTDVALAFKSVASAKSELLKDPKALSEVTNQVLLLKNAAGIDMAQSVDAVTSALNQFGAGADQAGRFVNVLAAGSKVGASEVFETKEAIINAGVAANQAGLSFESFNSLIQVMAKNGIKGARSGSELNALLLKMEAKMGSAAPSVIGMAESLKVLEGMNLDAGASMKMFGLESVDVLKILTGNVPLIQQWTKEMTGTSVAQEQASKRLSTFNSMMLGAKIRLINLSAGVFNVARPAFNALGQTVSNFLAGLDPSDVETFGLLLSGLGRIAQGVAVVIGGAFRAIMTVIKPVLAVLKGIGDITGQLAGAVATLNFSGFDLSDSFNLGGKALGLFGGGPATASPAVATANARATVNGEIKVSASEGSQVDSVESSNAFNGAQGNIGLGAAA